LSELKYQTQHVPALDGLRGYAALIVTFYHTILHLDTTLIARVLQPGIGDVAPGDRLAKGVLAVLNGGTAVSLFYALSGCVLCQSLIKASPSLHSIALFTVRRALRLFPPLMACLILMWTLAQAYSLLGVETFPKVSAWAAVQNALLIDTRVHSPSTSIQIEALATPFIVAFSLFYRIYSVPAALLMVAASIVAFDMPVLVFHLPNLNGCLLAFMMGTLVALPECAGLFSAARTTQIAAVLVGAFLIRQIVDLNALSGVVPQLMLIGAVVGFVRWSQGTALHVFLENRVSQFLGRISYSYYLLNVVVLWIIWFSPAFAVLQSWSNPLIGGLVVGAIAAAATLPLAFLSQKYCEAPFITLGRRLSRGFTPRRQHAV
jgi:peptidoglycan/LPS O-acetylase OafA/YrhL